MTVVPEAQRRPEQTQIPSRIYSRQLAIYSSDFSSMVHGPMGSFPPPTPNSDSMLRKLANTPQTLPKAQCVVYGILT